MQTFFVRLAGPCNSAAAVGSADRASDMQRTLRKKKNIYVYNYKANYEHMNLAFFF